jgi:glycosyltransferase involved in cell wall biosynthesis
MRVSVVVNNFNYERFVGEAIASAVAQSWGDTEVVVVDDGSTDGSREVIEGFGDRVRAVWKENGGQGSAYNAGFAVASGDVVIFLDADDVLLPSTVERVVGAFEAHPEAGKVQYRLAEVDAEGVPTGGYKPPLDRTMPTGDLRSHIRRHHGYWWPHASGNAYRQTVLRRILPMPEGPFRIGADAWPAYLAVMLAPIVSLDEVGGNLRIHGGNQYNRRREDDLLERVRRELALDHATHAALGRFAREIGFEGYPSDPRDIRQVGFLARRSISVRLDRAHHPIPQDGRVAVTRSGVASSLQQPGLPWLTRLKLASWFVALALAPRSVCGRLAARLLE